MEPWSEKPIHPKFKANFFLDTNILAYLVDKTFTGLSNSIKYFVKCEFTTLKSSRFVIFEFVKIRKKEHFLRVILSKTKSKKSGKVNLSSLLKYKDSYSHKGIEYLTEGNSIRSKIWRELKKINTEFKVDFENNDLHANIWKPTFDLYLASKLSHEDTLVLTSSTFPNLLIKEDDIYVLTNDEQLDKAYYDKDFSRKINYAFKANELNKPKIIHIEKFSSANTMVNLTKNSDDKRAVPLIINKVKEIILEKNKQFFIGNTIAVPAAAPANVICFELPINTRLYDNVNLVIVGKDLDFYYTTKVRINNFVDNMVALVFPYSRPNISRLAFQLNEINIDDGTAVDLPADQLIKMRQPGNLLFMHPDTVFI